MGKPAVGKKPIADKVTEGIGGTKIDPGVTPGKQTRTGDDYIDNGYQGGSFLKPDQRERLTSAFQMRTLAAESNYQDAAGDVRVDKLLEKDEDMHWLTGILIDLPLGFVVGHFVKKAIAFRDAKSAAVKATVSEITDRIAQNVPVDEKLTLAQRAAQSFGKVKDAHIKTAIETSGKIGKTMAINHVKGVRSKATERKETINYIDTLRDAATLAYAKFRELTPATASDAELIVLFEAMAPDNHLISQYKEAIEGKVKRFEASEVSKIGRELASRHVYSDDGRRAPSSMSKRVIRDVWVQWQTFESGHPRQLVFMHQDGKDRQRIDGDEPDQLTNGQAYLGHTHRKRELRDPYEAGGGTSNDPKSKYLVPDEFRETAITRHVQKWGTDPETVHIDDSDATYFGADRAKRAQENKAKKASVPKKQL